MTGDDVATQFAEDTGAVSRPVPQPAPLVPAGVVDVLLTVLVAGTAFQNAIGPYGPVDVVLVLAMTLPLLARRPFPEWVFGITYAATALALILREDPLASLGVIIALYTVAAQTSRRSAMVAACLLEFLALAVVWRLAEHEPVYVGIFMTGTVLAALGLGLYSGMHQAYLHELQQRAARLELERDQQMALAAAAERARIARELHDIVAHHLTVMVSLSDGAAAALRGAPDQAAEAIRSVSTTGRRALTDTRRLLGVLRDDSGEMGSREPVPGLADLNALIARIRATGLPVAYEVGGEPSALPPGVQLTIYRLVQEALTNTLKHGGPGSTATVRLRYESNEVHVEVEDDGAGPAAAVPAGVGRGLTGMRERAAAYDGAVSAGPRSTGGWAVRARLRLDEEIAP